MRIEPLAASSHLHTTSSGLPVVYDAEALETYFSTPDGAEALTGRLGKLARVTSGLGVRVGTTFLALLAGLAPPSVGPTALEDALAASPVREAFEELGPTFVKFGQALGSRPDLAGERLALQLRALQAEMAPFATADARAVIQAEFGEVAAAPLLRALPATPAAAASIGQVYKVQLPRGRRSLRRGLRRPPPQTLAVKVLRPDARAAVAADAVLARRAAGALESLRVPGGRRLVRPALVAAVDEFFCRLFEEMDYEREAENIAEFNAVYGRRTEARRQLGRGGEIVLPVAYSPWCGERVIAMSWVDGSPLVPPDRRAGGGADDLPAALAARLAGRVALSPARAEEVAPPPSPLDALPWVRPRPALGYIDFGLVSHVPVQVREGLVCAVAQLLFARDTAKVASLFGELMLLPPAKLDEPATRAALEAALARAASKLLDYPPGAALPEIRFDALVGEVAAIAPAFEFELPPYFLNNARALASLEGLARAADPTFSIVESIYPFALTTILAGDASPLMRRTLDDLATDPATGRVSVRKLRSLVDQLAALSRKPRLAVTLDVVRTRGGRRVIRRLARQALRGRGSAKT
ncbi:hypothetical protein EMIHUDRAFT_106581 [Emiliania huxleyi CCMP1516]|uniref:ABC1 atypical kinase-like domain-containing protein n=2 Tax=Emiliania huxleyi TaxID=2903 RepID=A0A0D3I8H2_EMIH1|nr:hypothetical protein EMIHUDRAFT_106581 [Emiliania huxleyi CCMP1516]EOD07557.1 hypothetical protein EMIHUDRAFT_106581 [Emiliania huxleyi CCMP1516]|eukprot:XP_005759986.1 hypothetical protein EMIHUDRAFT_106581 [Emiliania huxleyi CCMP1516]